MFAILREGEGEFVSRQGKSNRLLQLDIERDAAILLCLFTFQQTSDKINEELLIIVSVRNRHNNIIQHNVSNHFFPAQSVHLL